MSYEHKSLASDDCHEPKHFSTTTTADAGKVLTPSSESNGESELRELRIEEIDGYKEAPPSAYISLAGTGSSKTIPFSGGSPTEINSLFQQSGPVLNIDYSNNVITFSVTGIYQILMLPEIDSNTKTNVYYKYNNESVVAVDSVSDGSTVHGLFLLDIAENDTLQFQGRSTSSGSGLSSKATASFSHNIVITKVG